MRLSISTRRGWILPVVAALAIGLSSAQVAWAQDPPEIITHPESAVVCDGGAVTFTVVAIGDLPLEFQWYEDGAPIFGADESDYTIDPVGFGAVADYTVIVSGLEQGDSLVVLPTSGLIEELERREEWVRQRVGGPLSNRGSR